jgi:hypothetical protein
MNHGLENVYKPETSLLHPAYLHFMSGMHFMAPEATHHQLQRWE